jgi:hypothetical protein
MNRTWKSLVALVPLVLAVACVDPAKEPALTVIAAGEKAVAGITAEVDKLAPELSKQAKDGLAAAKAAAAKDDWKNAHAFGREVAMTAAQAIDSAQRQKAAIEAATAARAAELKAAWETAKTELPAKLEAMKKELAKLGKAKKLPKKVTKEAVTTAKADVAQLEVEFAKAGELAKTDVQAAGAASKELMLKASRTGMSIGM